MNLSSFFRVSDENKDDMAVEKPIIGKFKLQQFKEKIKLTNIKLNTSKLPENNQSLSSTGLYVVVWSTRPDNENVKFDENYRTSWSGGRIMA